MKQVELLIIGAGSAGMAAAKGAYDAGIRDILVVERAFEYGGILEQCIHNGFGLHTFNEELSGPAYAEKYYETLPESIQFQYDSTVMDISSDKIVTIQSSRGYEKVQAKAVILAAGCRERSAGAIGLRGDRPQGIYAAGAAQRYLNQEGYLVGKKVFILGSGDIGLIMARRMTLEGAQVIGVAELMPYSNGLARNIKQCLEDFNIPLYLSHTVTRVEGSPRLNSITLSQVDDHLQPIKGTEKQFDVDCLLLSIGLIPENSLFETLGIELDRRTKGAVINDQYMTGKEGIFACGNALHVHDLVDFVSQESYKCGKAAAGYIKGEDSGTCDMHNALGNGISYMIPHSFSNQHEVEFSFRTNKVFKKCAIHLYADGFEKKITKLSIVPSEMQKVKLTAEELQKINGNELHWEVI